MGVDRTDYLMWGAKVSPDVVREKYGDLEAEINGAPESLFDLIYDGMSGKYAVAGRVVARSEPYEGLAFKVIEPADLAWDAELVGRVRTAFPDAHEFSLILFSHYH